jgi:hypothetical protein
MKGANFIINKRFHVFKNLERRSVNSGRGYTEICPSTYRGRVKIRISQMSVLGTVFMTDGLVGPVLFGNHLLKR